MRAVQRAQILWRYQSGETVAQIARAVNTTRNSALKWIDKALQVGVMPGIKDTPHKPRQAVITDDAKAWVLHLVCVKPKDLGYAAELWTRSALAGHVRREAVPAGFPRWLRRGKPLSSASSRRGDYSHIRSDTTWNVAIPILNPKMRIVLLVFKEVAIENEAAGNNGGLRDVGTVSVDEKPGVQATANTAPDLPPGSGRYSTFDRDHEYVRHGTLSILAGLDRLMATSSHMSKSGTGVLSLLAC